MTYGQSNTRNSAGLMADDFDRKESEQRKFMDEVSKLTDRKIELAPRELGALIAAKVTPAQVAREYTSQRQVPGLPQPRSKRRRGGM